MRDLSEHRRDLLPEELAAIAAIVGGAHLLVARDDVEPFSHDWTEDFVAVPAAVARPRTVEEVSAVLTYCSARRIPVTPQAGRTGLSGGALALRGGLALSVDRMTSILEIDETNLVAVAEAGVVTQTLHEAVEAVGLYYPPDPASRASCCLGGNVAENAGGPHAAKYGITSKWVLGLEAVLASGEVVVTKAWLRLIPKPRSAAVLVAPFATLEEAAACVAAISRAGLVPAALEIVDKPSVDVSFRKKGLPVPFPEAEARLLVELDGGDDGEVERDVTRCGEVALEAGALDVVLATDEAKRRDLWEVRRGIGEAVRELGSSSELDLSVPRSELAALVRGVRRIASGAGLATAAFGHAADGNLHVHVYREGKSADDESRFADATRAIYAEACRLGGTVTGEHGVGVAARDVLALRLTPPALAVMRAIKDALDPLGILNPGKIFS